MPELSGFGVVEKFMNMSNLGAITVIVLTSDCRSADIAKSYKLDLGGYLVKATRRSDLHKAIMIVMNRPNGLGSTVSTNNAVRTRRPLCQVLLLEDPLDNALLIHAYLKEAACEIRHAENGQAGFEWFQDGHCGLVLMDRQMPMMDGYTATERIRDWERQHERQPVPILALTAFGMKEEAQKSLNAGCTAHLVKPIPKATLLAASAKYSRSVAS